jgi:hypothetical protein
MKRVDLALIVVTLLLGTVWYFLRDSTPASDPGSVAAGQATPRPLTRSSRPGLPRAAGEPAPAGLSVEAAGVRLAAGVDVVHKHAIGSCRGRLAATPAGLRYAPSKGDDGFDVPLGTVERLEADYPKKQLVVKLRGGRTYNFTEAGGHPEALVGFQQAVAKAQSRLATSAPK